MGSCTRRHFMLSICLLQMITIIQRQVFDFLGYMWAPILVNFFHIIFIILGFYGAYHFRIKYIITYLIWDFIWIGWNAFLICFYLNVGILDRDSDLLNLGTGSVSWFEVNGYGCKPTYPVNITSDDPFRPIRPERVDDCLLEYTVVEIVQSGVQCALALFGILGAILISYIFLDEDDRLKHVNKKSKHRQSLYSIEFGPSIDTIRSRADTILDYDDHLHSRDDGGELSPKPMTPRRVKRRSVMARGSNSRQSTTSRRSSHHGRERSESGTHPRNSTRSSRRKYQQNPVTKLLDQQQLQLQQQQHHHHHHHHQNHSGGGSLGKPLPKQQLGSFQQKETPAPLTASNLQTLNREIISNNSASDTAGGAIVDASDDGLNNIMMGGSGSLTKSTNHHYHNFRKNIPPDPIYYNTNAQTGLFQQTWHSNSQSPIVAADEPPPTPTLTPTLAGHFNPSYQHSTTNLNDVEHTDELYNNRPPSVRSSYSNFHGTRPLSSYISNSGTTENVFVGLTGAAQAQSAVVQQPQQHAQQQQQLQNLPTLPPLPPHVAPATPPLYQTNPLNQHSHLAVQQQIPPLPSPKFASSAPQNIPFGKRTASRESIRSMAFLNSGPPAYNLNYHTPPDSETTM